jgi:hypothetical protein
MCLASHDGTQIFTDAENILKDKVEEVKVNRKEKTSVSKMPNTRPKEFNNYRVSVVVLR